MKGGFRMDSKALFGRIFFRLGYGFVTTFFGVFAGILYTVDGRLPQWLKISLPIVFLLSLTFILILYERRKILEEEAKDRALEAQLNIKEQALRYEKERIGLEIDKAKLNLEKQLKDYALLCRTLEGLADVMRDTLMKTSNFNDRLGYGLKCGIDEKDAGSFSNELKNQKDILVTKILSRICDNLEAQPYLPESATDIHTFFKATIFEPRSEDLGRRVLERVYHKYPPLMAPRTKKIEEEKLKPNEIPAAFRAWNDEEIVIIPNVPEEHRKAEEGKDSSWVDLWRGQHKEYESMVCFPIIKGIPRSRERKLIGILTIDTDRKEYFKDDRTTKAFLSDVFHPSCIFIALLYELERLQQFSLELLKKVK